MGGGGSNRPQAVAPTVNTNTVQHQGTGSGHVGGTTGGKSGGNPFGTPQQNPQQIQFGGYGQQSPFGMTNPASWGVSGQHGLGGVQTAGQWKPQNTFNPTAFSQSDQSSGPVAAQPTSGTIDTGAGTSIAYDNASEQRMGQNIADTIAAGGVNPETGDNNIVAGPNVLSAGDEGTFGFGNDYNKEFGENYDAQAAHAANNPYGQSTGTPIYEQGYVGISDPVTNTVGGVLNNSIVGSVGSAITGEPMIANVDSLLPPVPTNNNNDNDTSWMNDGDPTNDQGNAGWGFTSFADMFDGGGPGQSGDSYTGGIHGDKTVGSTAQGVTSIVTNPSGSNDNDNDSGGGSSGGK